MKMNITVDFNDFMSEHDTFDEFVENVIKSEILKAVKRDPQWKDFIAKCAAKAIEKAQE